MRASASPAAMHANALSRVMLLRQTLLQHGDADAVQDLLQHANTLMQMLLKHEVSIDLGSTGRENTLLAKVAQLVQLGAGIGDEGLRARVAAHLQAILSACLSSCMCNASAKPTGSDTMSTHDKLQSVRASLLRTFQT